MVGTPVHVAQVIAARCRCVGDARDVPHPVSPGTLPVAGGTASVTCSGARDSSVSRAGHGEVRTHRDLRMSTIEIVTGKLMPVTHARMTIATLVAECF